jgi:hypothetical protein
LLVHHPLCPKCQAAKTTQETLLSKSPTLFPRHGTKKALVRSITPHTLRNPSETSFTGRLCLYADGLATSGMFLAGLIMVTRNRFLAWPATLIGINSLVNQHPMRQKESMAGWSNVGCVILTLFRLYYAVLNFELNLFPLPHTLTHSYLFSMDSLILIHWWSTGVRLGHTAYA